MRPKAKKLLMFAPFAILGMALVAFIGGEIVKLLWNWLVPSLFGWQPVTFWQALGLLALCRILFGGNGLMKRQSRRYSPEERERFRAAFRKRFGFTFSAGDHPEA